MFPILSIMGPGGSGKSTTLRTVARFCFKANEFSCENMTHASFRDELIASQDGTAIIEEADTTWGVTSSENLVRSRCMRSTAKSGKKVSTGPNGGWVTESKLLFGATVMHKREPFSDVATESRNITVRTKISPDRRPHDFREISDSDPRIVDALRIFESVASVELLGLEAVECPKEYNVISRIMDTWKPIIAVAELCEDNDYLANVWQQLEEESESIRAGAAHEPAQLVLQGLIAALAEYDAIDPDRDELRMRPVKVEEEILNWLQRTHGKHVNSWQAAKILRGYGLEVKKSGGINRVYPTFKTLIEACKTAGIEDELVDKLTATP